MARCCDDRWKSPSTQRLPSAGAARCWVYDPRWAASATVSTTPWPKAFLRLSSVKCWIAMTSRLETKHVGRSSPGSRVGIIRIVDTPPSGIFHHRSTRDALPRTHSLPSAACAADRPAVQHGKEENSSKIEIANSRPSVETGPPHAANCSRPWQSQSHIHTVSHECD